MQNTSETLRKRKTFCIKKIKSIKKNATVPNASFCVFQNILETHLKHIGNTFETHTPTQAEEPNWVYSIWIYLILQEVYFEGLRCVMHTLQLREVLISKKHLFLD